MSDIKYLKKQRGGNSGESFTIRLSTAVWSVLNEMRAELCAAAVTV